MAGSADDDLTRAEREYVLARMREQIQTAGELEQRLGEPITEAHGARALRDFRTGLRAGGNHVLAERLLSAQVDFELAQQAALQAPDDSEAANAADDAGEQFERVLAEVEAWFDRLKGRTEEP